MYVFSLFLLNCKENEKNELTKSDIVKIVNKSNRIVNNITGNYYILDERFKESGKHRLMINSNEINLIKKRVIEEDIYELDNYLEFIKTCQNKPCLSEIIIQYKSGRIQHFIFDNYNYRSNISDKSYGKIASLEELISKIIMSKKIDPEPVNTSL